MLTKADMLPKKSTNAFWNMVKGGVLIVSGKKPWPWPKDGEGK